MTSVLECFCGARIQAEPTIGAIAAYRRAWIQGDSFFRADLQTTLAIALSKSYAFAAAGHREGVSAIFQGQLKDIHSS